jgi:hypothetical protein
MFIELKDFWKLLGLHYYNSLALVWYLGLQHIQDGWLTISHAHL